MRRRKKSLKFHGIAIGAICAVVIVLFLLIGPKEGAVVDPDAGQGDRYVRLVSATWGQNCNIEIDRLRKQGKVSIDRGGQKVPLTAVQPNNVLYQLSERCNDRITCNIVASKDVMGIDPLPTCFKRLSITYRCFSIDRAWRAEVPQGELLKIDCNQAADKDRK